MAKTIRVKANQMPAWQTINNGLGKIQWSDNDAELTITLEIVKEGNRCIWYVSAEDVTYNDDLNDWEGKPMVGDELIRKMVDWLNPMLPNATFLKDCNFLTK